MKDKIIAVIGATGAQGSGLVKAILDDPEKEFIPRALTRNVDSDAAKELANAGAEVVKFDIDDLESIENAFNGAYGAYCVTFYWEHFSPEKEIAQVRSLAKIAKDAELEHVIWSTLEDTRNLISLDDDRMPTLMEKYKVPHFDAKGESNRFFDEQNVPTTFLLTSFYWENLITFGMGPKKDENGNITFSLPMGDKKLPGIASEDIGKCAFGIFKSNDEYKGSTVGIAGDHLSGDEMAKIMGSAFNQNINYSSIPFDVYRNLGFPGADDLGNMFQFKHDFENQFCEIRDLELSRKLNPSLQSFEKWISKNWERIAVE